MTIKTFNPKKSISKAQTASKSAKWKLATGDKLYAWTSNMERVGIIRGGVPYGSIETISKRINAPIKEFLTIFGLPQTTYNKKKKEKTLLNPRDSEVILVLTELLDYGIEVFNNEEDKFNRWLKKSNLSLGGNTPESFLDSITGIQEVRNCLNRIQYGNLA